MKNIAIVAFAFLAVAGGGANAADIYNQGGSTKDAPSTFDAPTTVNWTGFYIGGSIGYGNANHDLTVQDYFKDYCADKGDKTVGFDGSPGERTVTVENFNEAWEAINKYSPDWFKAAGIRSDCATQAGHTNSANINGDFDIPKATSVATATVPGDSRDVANLDGLNSHGIVGDVRLGADLQLDRRFVVGVFGSYGFNGMETEGSISFGRDTAGFTIEKGDEWSIGARAGILVNPRTLAYVLAAYTATEYDFSIHGGDDSKSKTVDFSGITAGAGVEFALTNNIFLGIEGTHTFYGEETVIDEYDADRNQGDRLLDEIGETKVMGTLKIKLNSGLPDFGN